MRPPLPCYLVPSVNPVREPSTLRQVCQTALERLDAGDPDDAVAQDLSGAIGVLNNRTAQASLDESLTWGESLIENVLSQVVVARESASAGQITLGLSTGFGRLDRALNGFTDGSVYVMAGAPGAGKTSLSIQFACNVAAANVAPVLYITFENSPENLAFKAFCRLGGLSPTAVERGRADPNQLRVGLEAYAALAPRLAFLPGHNRTTLAYIHDQAREAMARHNAPRCLIVIDYLQCMLVSDPTDHARGSISALSLGLRELAAELRSPILAISTMARDVSDAESTTLRSLRDSGDLEYGADVVLLLGPRSEASLSSVAKSKAAPGIRLTDLVVAKNRYGEADRRIPMFFRPALGEFEEESAT